MQNAWSWSEGVGPTTDESGRTVSSNQTVDELKEFGYFRMGLQLL